MAQLIEMTFGLRTRVGPRNHVLDGIQVRREKGQFWGVGKGWSVVKYGDSAVSCTETAEPIEMSFATWTQVGPRKHVWGYTLRIPLNHPYAAAMRPVVKSL